LYAFETNFFIAWSASHLVSNWIRNGWGTFPWGAMYIFEVFRKLAPDAKWIDYSDRARDFLLKNSKTEVYRDFTLERHSISLLKKYSNGFLHQVTSNELIAMKQNDFKGWSCDIGHNLMINWDGQVFHGACNVVPTIGHILEGNLKFVKEPIICPKNFCHCGSDIITPKRKYT